MAIVITLLTTFVLKTVLGTVVYNSTYHFDASATASNPLKGFVPYYLWVQNQPNVNDLPYSMENYYIPMKNIMTGTTSFDFSSIDTVLTNIAKRNHHAILRVYIDFPGYNLRDSLPDFLWNGLTIYAGNADQGFFPDYNNQTLIDCIVNLIHALGKQYDGDKRIGFWQIGFLGHWGEWHTWPNGTYFASTYHQDQVLSAFNSSFMTTKLQIRYFHVTGSHSATSWNVGFHDDSFAQDTYGEDWMFYNQSVQVGADQRWRSQPIGGEIRPELMPCLFASDAVTACRAITDLIPLNWTTCVELTHSTFQWHAYPFMNPMNKSDLARTINASIMLGYSFFVSQILVNEINCSVCSHFIRISVTMSNIGVAPFYYPLTLNAKAVNSITQSLILTKSITVPLANQLDQNSYIYDLDMKIEANTNVQFSIWLDSSYLVGNQKIVFAISNASSSGIIQLPVMFIRSCNSQNSTTNCTSYLHGVGSNGIQRTSYIGMVLIFVFLAISAY